MHLWPTKTIRESWKLPHMRNLERAISQKRAQRRAQEQRLLDSDGGSNNTEALSGEESKLRSFCRDLVFLVTCCFCCGVCMDEMDYYSSY